jgi:hypothetical protein
MKTPRHDPAFWMVGQFPDRERPVFREGCYICEDDEFRTMGLPLCFPCFKCKGHVAADDDCCDDCGADQRDDPSLYPE